MKLGKKLLMVLLLLSMATATGTLAYWASGISGSNDTATAEVLIDSGEAVTTTVTVGNETNAGPLVPLGYTGITDVNLIFDVDWDGAGATGSTGTLVVTVNSVLVNSIDRSTLFTVNVTSEPTIVAGVSYPYTVNVEFTTEPANLADYNAMINQDVVVTLTFTVTP